MTGGTLTLGSGITLNVNSGLGFSAAGTYTLFNYSGATLSGVGNLTSWTFTGVPSATADFHDTGTSITVSFNSTITPNYFDTNGNTAGIGFNGGTATWDTSTLNWNPVSTGTGTPKTYDSTQATIFGGTSTTVTVIAGGVAADGGLQFISSGYAIQGGKITMGGATPTIFVQNVGDTATINSTVSGAGGLTKTGPGTLVLGGANDYVGTTTISAGTLSISSDANLGAAANALALGGSTLKVTADVPLAATRAVDGGGTLDVAPGKTFTVNGTFGATTAGAVTLANTGTVTLANSTVSLTSLTISAAATLNVTGTIFTLPATTTTTHSSGTAKISDPMGINMGTTGHSISVAAGGTLVLDAALSGTGTLAKANSGGTLALNGDNSGYSGNITMGGVTTSGGTVSINSAKSLGTATFNFDTGTLSNDSGVPLTGANAIATNLSLGAQTAGGGAILAGSDMEFTGGVSIFKSGTLQQQQLVVNNTTTFSGVFGISNGTGTSTGVTIAGSGKLIFAGALPNTFAEPVTVGTGIGTGPVLAIAKTDGLGTNSVTVKNGATLLVGEFNGVSVAGSISGPTSVQSGGTFTGLGTTGDITLQSGATLSPGTSNKTIGTLTGTNLTWDGGATMKFELGATPSASDKFALGTGVLTKGAAGAYVFDFQNTGTAFQSFQLLTFGSVSTFAATDFSYVNLAPAVTGSFVLSATDLAFVTVPEPGSLSCLAIGMAGLLGIGRRRRKAA